MFLASVVITATENGCDINRRLKVLRILSQRYRNHRKGFGWGCHLIAGIYSSWES